MWVNCSEVDELRACYRLKSEREKQILYTNAYIWNLKKNSWWTYLQRRNGDTDIENWLVEQVGRGPHFAPGQRKGPLLVPHLHSAPPHCCPPQASDWNITLQQRQGGKRLRITVAAWLSIPDTLYTWPVILTTTRKGGEGGGKVWGRERIPFCWRNRGTEW